MSWDLTHVAVQRFGATWNHAVRKVVWRLPNNSHLAHPVRLNSGSQASKNIDFIVKAWKLESITTLNE